MSSSLKFVVVSACDDNPWYKHGWLCYKEFDKMMKRSTSYTELSWV